MGAESRGTDPSLAEELLDEGYRFDFFEAVRVLERLYPHRQPVGHEAVPSEEVVRFLEAVPGLKARMALTTAYAAGLRLCEVVALKVLNSTACDHRRRAQLRREAERGTFDPTYLVYTAGKLMLLKLRQDSKQRLGKAFSLRSFHDTLLANGTAPFWLHRHLMLGDDSPKYVRTQPARCERGHEDVRVEADPHETSRKTSSSVR